MSTFGTPTSPSSSWRCRRLAIRWQVRDAVALLTRTIIELSEDSEAKVVAELASRTAADAPALLTGATEVRLDGRSNLSFASVQNLSDGRVAFQQRTAAI